MYQQKFSICQQTLRKYYKTRPFSYLAKKGNPKFAHRLNHFFLDSFSSRCLCSQDEFNRSILIERARQRIDRSPRTGYTLHLLRRSPESVVGRQDQCVRMRDGSRIVRCPRPVETFDHRVPRSRDHWYCETPPVYPFRIVSDRQRGDYLTFIIFIAVLAGFMYGFFKYMWVRGQQYSLKIV